MPRIIIGCIIALLAVLLGIYAVLASRKKGPIFSNTYIFLSPEEKKRADKAAEYKLVTVIFAGLSGVFALLALNIFTGWKWAYILMWAAVVFVVVYAVADAVKTEKNRK